MQEEERGRNKAYKQKYRVYISGDKEKVIVVMDKSLEKGRENS